ncbi:MAG: helix-hairpin-helix domain-containing protein [Flavobacterium sp.]|nr:helix-hairpin-helix domain-containing protein [Aeromicrobium sp.]
MATVSVAAAVLLVWWLLSGRPEASDPVAPLAFGQTSAPSMSQSTAPSSGTSGATPSTSATEQLVIDVIGKVRKPGIVSVPKGSRVYQAIEAAGGPRGRVDTASLNMARVLSDGEQILVGLEPAEVPGLPSGAAAGAGGGNGAGPASGVGAKVNLNTATAEQLDTLPGVGPVTAKSILDWREKNGRFGAVDDLLDVKGIGDATLAELRDLVIV